MFGFSSPWGVGSSRPPAQALKPPNMTCRKLIQLDCKIPEERIRSGTEGGLLHFLLVWGWKKVGEGMDLVLFFIFPGLSYGHCPLSNQQKLNFITRT